MAVSTAISQLKKGLSRRTPSPGANRRNNQITPTMGEEGKQLKPENELLDEARCAVAKILSSLLADEYLLKTCMRSYLWNITPPDYHDLPEFFMVQYDELEAIVDEVAGRVRSKGRRAPETLTEILDRARLKEDPAPCPRAASLFQKLLTYHGAIIQLLQVDTRICTDKYHCLRTGEFLVELMEKHGEMFYAVRGYLKENPD